MSTKATFLDRDGVINQKAPEGAYITRWEDMKFLPGVIEGISQFNRAGWKVIVISNQRCVAKGLISVPELEVLHRRMVDWLREHGARIDAVYYCPHEKTIPPCDCRKPEPGMLLQAAREHDIDIANSWMIGDSPSDIEAGRRAGCRTLHIPAPGKQVDPQADLQATSLLDAASQVVRMHAVTVT